MWHPKIDDLAPWMTRQMEAAYRTRLRERCSRDDFYDGYLAALRDLRSASSFQTGRFDPEPSSESEQ